MGKYINTSYADSIQSISDMGKDLISHPYYPFNDKRGIIVTKNYYNINKEMSTLDEGAQIHQSELGPECPFRYNRIKGLILYGFPKIELNMDIGDFGLESSEITGECYLMPNTITPIENDYFEIPFLEDNVWLFKVTKVDPDTLPNGYNVYKISFILDRTDNESSIMDLVVKEFTCVDVQDGTEIRAVVEDDKFNFAKRLDDICTALKSYYIDLFFNRYVQTFVVDNIFENYNYDPYLIEFIIRNDIVNMGGRNYISVIHQLPLPTTFAIEYDRSIFKAIEDCNKEKLFGSRRSYVLQQINCLASIFNERYETYYKTTYVSQSDNALNTLFAGTVMDDDLTLRIEEKRFFEPDDKNRYMNIFIKFFHHMKLDDQDLVAIEDIDYDEGKYVFYRIPILIFCLESYIKNLLK